MDIGSPVNENEKKKKKKEEEEEHQIDANKRSRSLDALLHHLPERSKLGLRLKAM